MLGVVYCTAASLTEGKGECHHTLREVHQHRSDELPAGGESFGFRFGWAAFCGFRSCDVEFYYTSDCMRYCHGQVWPGLAWPGSLLDLKWYQWKVQGGRTFGAL